MRFYALSDIHVDYPQNLEWIDRIDSQQFQDDVLILAGDATDDLQLLEQILSDLRAKFYGVSFVPGNHELWLREGDVDCSLEKFHVIDQLCQRLDVSTQVQHFGQVSLVPLYSWYDFSFGEPGRHLLRAWRDFRACTWPDHFVSAREISEHFLAMNTERLNTSNDTVISFSHFLPRIDVMPERIPEKRRFVYPVLGSDSLGKQVAQLNPDIHVYGHSHVNRAVEVDDIHYVNNAFAYPSEERISRKRLHCVFDTAAGAES